MSAWTGQAADDFPDRNQLAALTLHGFYSPMCLRQGKGQAGEAHPYRCTDIST